MKPNEREWLVPTPLEHRWGGPKRPAA